MEKEIIHGDCQEEMKRYICPVCKKVIQKKLYKKVQTVYCCQACVYKGRTLGYSKRIIKKPYNCRRKQPRKCVFCGKEYIYKSSKQKHCSRKCFLLNHKEHMRGKNNPAWISGNSYDKRCYRGDNWEDIRKAIYSVIGGLVRSVVKSVVEKKYNVII